MDLQTLRFRSGVVSSVRDFFSSRNFLETDTPALAGRLVPESCLEVFRTEYVLPFREGAAARVPLFLLPSPELYLKKIIAAHGVSVFQISKCYRNCESTGRIHSPEFTMLEYYQVGADAEEMQKVTEDLFSHIARRMAESGLPVSIGDGRGGVETPFKRTTVDGAFSAFAGVSLSGAAEGKSEAAFLRDVKARLVAKAVEEGLGDADKLGGFSLHDLYDIIFVQCVEPAVAAGPPVFLTDYPAFVPCLAAEKPPAGNTAPSAYKTRDRWELYAGGVELANCYTEERDEKAVEAFFREEGALKEKARVPHPSDETFAALCAEMPPCAGVAMGIDRLVMFLSGKKTIDSVLPFPLDVAAGTPEGFH